LFAGLTDGIKQTFNGDENCYVYPFTGETKGEMHNCFLSMDGINNTDANKISALNNTYQMYPLATFDNINDYYGAAIVRWKQQGDYRGTAITIGHGAYQWNYPSNPNQHNIERLTKNAIDELQNTEPVLAQYVYITITAGEHGTGAAILDSVVKDSAYTLPVNLFEAEDQYRFIGWTTTGTDTLKAGDTITSVSGNLTLTALWEKMKPTDVEGGLEEHSAFVIYPNPVVDILHINYTTIVPTGKIEIYDLNGKCVKTKTISNQNTINLSTLPAGTYLVKTGNKLTKIIKQ
jgi:uncharacterized repeat protein (TIGR02543 family)